MSKATPKRPYHLMKPNVDDYVRGFVLAVVLTAIPFILVAYGDISRNATMVIISALALIQVGVHLRYFLHYSTERAPFEATVALVIGVFMAGLFTAGCIWVMMDLAHRMMP